MEEKKIPKLTNAPATRHRIGTVCGAQGVSLRTISRNWNVDIVEVRRQQEETSDLMLSQLYRWQKMLGVPVADLLVEESRELSDPIRHRAQLIKLMKTAVTMKETARDVRIQGLITTLLAQLVEIMPELADVGPWHGSGSHRTLDDLGRAADCRLSDDML